MKVAYFDCIAGISGDMTLAALLDAGLTIEALTGELRKLGLPGWSIEPRKVEKSGIRATLAQVHAEEHHHHRHYSDIAEMISASDLEPNAKDLALRVFRRLGEAEAKVHGTSLEEVHFHEVGAVDSIVDIVGSCIGLTQMGIQALYGSPLPWTHGTVTSAHGVMPIPAPATAELMQGWPVRPLDIEGELVTPTGAAILTTLAQGQDMPEMTVSAVGYGAGHKDLPGRPNVLRVVIGEVADQLESDSVIEVEANLDDMNPEWLPPAMDAIMQAGALDVYLAPLTMKKGRPAFRLSALCEEGTLQAVARAILRHTTSLGVRYKSLRRLKLQRKSREVDTPWGPVHVKLAYMGDERVNAAPEFEDCRRLAEAVGVPLKDIYAAAIVALS